MVADRADRLLIAFVSVPNGVILPLIAALVAMMFYYFNNHMFL